MLRVRGKPKGYSPPPTPDVGCLHTEQGERGNVAAAGKKKQDCTNLDHPHGNTCIQKLEGWGKVPLQVKERPRQHAPFSTARRGLFGRRSTLGCPNRRLDHHLILRLHGPQNILTEQNKSASQNEPTTRALMCSQLCALEVDFNRNLHGVGVGHFFAMTLRVFVMMERQRPLESICVCIDHCEATLYVSATIQQQCPRA